MRQVWLVIRREYLENVRTKAFLVGLVLTPVWMALIFVVPAISPDREDVIVVVDATGELEQPLRERLADHPGFEVRAEPAAGAFAPGPDGLSRIDRLRQAAGAGELLAVVLTPPVLEKRPPREGEHAAGVYGSNNVGAIQAGKLLAEAVDDLVDERLLSERDIAEDDIAFLRRAAVRYRAVTPEGEAGNVLAAVAPFVFMMLLFMGIMAVSQMLVNSTLEEKGSRVYEILLSSVSPTQLMTGKILGICGVGLTLMALWIGGGAVAAGVQGLGGIVSIPRIGWFIVYYLFGFLLFASLMVAIGSACNTLKEAQNLMAPISFLLAMPLLLGFLVMGDPNGTVAVVSSFVPPFTPFVMMARMASVPAPPAWQAWATLVLLLGSSVLAMRLAARVFRVGVLLYGQPPSLGRIVRWMLARP